jgi:AbrB family looped-hinge helix DNA binding protein
MRTTISQKGQITVPKLLRERLGIRAGDQLDVTEENGRLIAVKAVPVDPVASVYGILNSPRSTDDLIDELRGEPEAL